MNQNQLMSIVVSVLILALAGTAGYAILSKKTAPATAPTVTSIPVSIKNFAPTSSQAFGSTATSTSMLLDSSQVAFQDLDVRCLGTGGNREFVVRTQAEYQNVIDISPDLYPNPLARCIEYKFPSIDFSQQTLLGKSVTGSGCSSEVEKRVVRTDAGREVVYTMTVRFIGSCEKMIFHPNWIVVPKIPEDYRVIFHVYSQRD